MVLLSPVAMLLMLLAHDWIHLICRKYFLNGWQRQGYAWCGCFTTHNLFTTQYNKIFAICYQNDFPTRITHSQCYVYVQFFFNQKMQFHISTANQNNSEPVISFLYLCVKIAWYFFHNAFVYSVSYSLFLIFFNYSWLSLQIFVIQLVTYYRNCIFNLLSERFHTNY